ncbi:putative bifunctional diguanylate cyclase/phosphodiesterase [Pseudoalteromonas sp. G4]|uniref:putative bifunctional diguanylate cyclase/phosphodiesterase n=1 Tax=Pseudoalteromonas sp. G4 TaxID=2992761 RepID=UPI00237E058F|nr:bifunctional diguanylate cyclase/phosphodiesterase [Pseudoalteromonas sp. G4]MDE3271545.1 bifunctional diguanylate cyclase/phosphodiesterase [Pseudoalteromonas sp. G4]
MYDLSEIKHFYRSFLGRLFIIIVALLFVLASTLIAMHYQNHMAKVDEKIKAHSEFIMSTSVTQLEQHLVVFTMAERLLSEIPENITVEHVKNVNKVTFSHFPYYLTTQFFLLDDKQQLTPLLNNQKAVVKTPKNISELGLKQTLRTNQLLISVPYAVAEDNTLRLPISYLTQLKNSQHPILISIEVDLNSQHNPWRYDILDRDMEILVTQKSAMPNQYWSLFHTSPKSLHGNKPHLYGQQMPAKFVDYVNQSVKKITGRTVDRYKQSDGISIYTNRTLGIPHVRVGISYNNAFNTFVAVRLPLKAIYSEVSNFAAWVSTFCTLAIAISFFITRHLYRLDKVYKNKLYQQANFDQLTKLANRYFFDNTLVNDQAFNQGKYTLMCVDLDNFKHINDRFGRHTGDKTLQLVADRISHCCGSDALAVRTGGDEFFIILQSTDRTKSASLASNILSAISVTMILDNLKLSISASIGIYHADEIIEPQTAEIYAEIAMFEAKKLKNRYCFFDKGLAEQLHYRVDIETELKSAIQNKELYLTYQPQICTEQSAVKGLEVLLRWQNKKLGFVPPDKFIPIAEETGLIAEIGEFVIQQALHDYAKHLKFTEISLSINVSAYQLMYTPLFEILKRHVEHYQISPKCIILEVTESIFIEDKAAVQGLFDKLMAYGFLISLDDFGTGYSSLSQIRDYPIHELKIDRSFITHIHEKDQDAALLHQIVSIAKCHNILTVAEGVEIDAQHNIVRALGIDIEQGYLHAKPMEINALKAFLATQEVTQKAC